MGRSQTAGSRPRSGQLGLLQLQMPLQVAAMTRRGGGGRRTQQGQARGHGDFCFTLHWAALPAAKTKAGLRDKGSIGEQVLTGAVGAQRWARPQPCHRAGDMPGPTLGQAREQGGPSRVATAAPWLSGPNTHADDPEGCALPGPLGKSWGMSLLSLGHQPARPSQGRTAKGCGAEDGQ